MRRADHMRCGAGWTMAADEKEKTYQTSGGVDAGITSPDAVKPLGLGKLPKTVLLHDAGARKR